jgi:poly-gamma-glutamate capsule biosynthesis protein CapA/YwtB (metallophosphatase superfamily)
MSEYRNNRSHKKHTSRGGSQRKGHGNKKRVKMTVQRRKRIIRIRLTIAFLILAVIVCALIFVKAQSDKRKEGERITASNIGHAKVMVDFKAVDKKYNAFLKEAEEQQKIEAKAASDAQKEKEENEFKEECVHFIAAGDNLIHEKVYQSADMSQPVWNYDALYENVSDYVAKADIAAVNQETPFVADHSEVSGYPDFGTPTEIGDALIEAGFDVFQFATNHMYDKGMYGIESTINYCKLHPDKTYLGIHESEEDASNIKVVESKGIKIAMLNYSTFLNKEDETLPSYVIDRPSEERIMNDVANAKNISDFVIIFLHDGTEYDPQPSDSQRIYENAALEAGADALICSHSHVLEGFNTVTRSDGHEMLVYYGLGNFISSQDSAQCLLGGMADFYIHKDEVSGECEVYYEDLVPTVTHYDFDSNYFTVYLLEDYTDELAANHSITDVSGEVVDLEYFNYYADIAKQAVY